MPTEKSFEEILQRFREIEFHETFDMIVAIANGGIIPATILNQRLNIDIQLLKINLRDPDQKPKYDRPKLVSPIDFEYKGKKNSFGGRSHQNRGDCTIRHRSFT